MKRRNKLPRNAARNRPAAPTAYPAVAGILDSLPFGVVLLADGCLIDGINMEGARMLGQQPSSLFGQSFATIWSALTESNAAAVMARLQTVSTSREPLPLATTRLRLGRTGSIPVQWTCQAIDCEGRLSRANLAVSLRDLSREEELREERDRLAAIAEETPSPIIELDRHGHILYANPAMTVWLATLGYRADGIPSILPHDLPQLVARCLQSVGTMQGREVVLPEASFTWTFCPVTAHGLVRGYAIDMTRIHETQRALRRTADQLQDSNRRLDEALTLAQESARAKAAFLAMMSHEMRTPMNGVIGMTSLLMETALSAEQKTYANTIHQCGESLLHLINDVLECSKIEAGKLELECIDFNLRTAVDDILAQFAQRAEIKGLELTGLVHAAVPTALRGDPGRLRQVLTNLVANAIKFTEQGEVTLHAYLEKDLPNIAVVRFEVTDSGIGIEPDTQAKLFRPFVQADSSTTRKYGGTGLGLTICKQLIELMGGHIGINSAAGHGSTFWCTARFIKQTDSPRAILPSGDLNGRRALIVDDNESSRMIVHHLVTGWGMIADMAENAEDALRRISEASRRQTTYDLAILDIMMPGKDGLQLARELRQDPAGANIRIVLLTSLLQRGHAEQARQAGILSCLPKPVRHDQLRECLRKVLGIAPDTGQEQQQAPPASPQIITSRTLAESAPRKRILIAEDNIINQKLAERMVHKLGYQPDVVGNGQDVLDALANENYALILMDCQMPVLDGFEATRRIRERERSQVDSHHAEGPPSESVTSVGRSNLRHIPIIAVTANAMEGDRAHCLETGMDDYLAKPIHLEALRTLLHRWVAKPTPPSRAVEPVSTAHSSERGLFDAATVFRNIGEDNHLFGQLIAQFLNRHQAILIEIKDGLAKADALAVERAAHTLKGTAGNLCAPEVLLAASRLETLGRLGTLQNAPPVYAQLEMEVLRLARILGRYRQGYGTLSSAA